MNDTNKTRLKKTKTELIAELKVQDRLLKTRSPSRDQQEKFNTAVQEAEQANRSKSEFLAIMSHELRTPLNAILGFSDMLQNEYFGPLGGKQYIEYSKIIHESGNHLLALINDILDISAIEAGRLNLRLEAVSLNGIIEDCIKSVAYPARKKKITMKLNTPDTMPALRADKRAVKQIILNLLANAVKFSTRGGSVTIAVVSQSDTATITITDTGIGIAQNHLPKIMDPFVRGTSNAHLSQEGTGLGLSIVKSLIEAHNGNLDIASEVGKGTTVSVTLPVNRD